ncbi:MAG TPA: hypothetical protein VFR67_22320 [Pilimelia sp.]|nr:hypothetical protein [Pilimelia sp.]
MRRLFWLGVGLAAGALVVRAVTKKAQALTPQGIAGSVQQSAGELLESVRTFVDDVREGMAEREREIHAAFAEGVLIDDLDDDTGMDDDIEEDGAGWHRSQEGIR